VSDFAGIGQVAERAKNIGRTIPFDVAGAQTVRAAARAIC